MQRITLFIHYLIFYIIIKSTAGRGVVFFSPPKEKFFLIYKERCNLFETVSEKRERERERERKKKAMISVVNLCNSLNGLLSRKSMGGGLREEVIETNFFFKNQK